MAVNFVFLGLMVVVSLYAWVRGGAPERIGAAIFVAGVALTALVARAPAIRFNGFEAAIFLVDTLTFLAFTALAARANRFWPIWVSALLGVAVVGHVAVFLDTHIIRWAYAVILSIWSYPILALIAAGTWTHRRRLKGSGTDPSWSRFSHQAGPMMPIGGQER